MEVEEERLQESLLFAEKETADVHDIMPRITDTYRVMVENLNNISPDNTVRVREDIKNLLGNIKLNPDHVAKKLDIEINNCYESLTRKVLSSG